jgi:hypothetical protein
LTKKDQLVKIIEKFEKKDTLDNIETSREINGLAVRSDFKKNGDFIQFVHNLCERDDTPNFDKDVARTYVN